MRTALLLIGGVLLGAATMVMLCGWIVYCLCYGLTWYGKHK